MLVLGIAAFIAGTEDTMIDSELRFVEELFKLDICWNKCRQRGPHTKTFFLSGATYVVQLCDKCFREIDPADLIEISVPVEELLCGT